MVTDHAQAKPKSVPAPRRLVGQLLVLLLVGAVLYLPIRREVIDRGLIPASAFSSKDGSHLTLYGNGRYVRSGRTGMFTLERYPEAPWISLVRFDNGETLHVPYEDRVYQVEDISILKGADLDYLRN